MTELTEKDASQERQLAPVQIVDNDARIMLRSMYPSMTDEEEALFVTTCNRLLLDPAARQIFPVWRSQKVGDRYKDVMAIQVSIDGFRIQAERSHKYQGQVGPLWCGPDGIWKDVWLDVKPPAAAKVGVWRVNAREPIWGTATWREYVQKTKNGEPNRMWATMPSVMLAKCAEAIALRRALPYELSGVYTEDEMGQADNPVIEHQAAVTTVGPNISVPDDFSGRIEDTTSVLKKMGEEAVYRMGPEAAAEYEASQRRSSNVASSEGGNEEPPSRPEQQERWENADKLVALGKGEQVSRDSDPDMKRFLQIQEAAAGVEMKVSIPRLPFKRTSLVQMSESLLKAVNKKLEQLDKEPFSPPDPEAPPLVIDAEAEESASLTASGEESNGLGALATDEQLGVITRLADEKGIAEIQVDDRMYVIAEIITAPLSKEFATMVMSTLREMPAVPEDPDA